MSLHPAQRPEGRKPALQRLLLLGLLLQWPLALAEGTAPGSLSEVERLDPAIWQVPGEDPGNALRITYWTQGPQGAPSLSSGAIFLPSTPPPAGGYPVLSWAHGTVGIGDQCAPTRHGPVYAEITNPYLAHWLAQGYAIVATDYVGLGTPGDHPYADIPVAGYNVIDMVRAARQALPGKLSSRWAPIGQSQGAQASIFAASVAADYAPELELAGSVSTGLIGYLDRAASLLILLAPHAALPVPISDATAYVVFTLAGLRAGYPSLNIDQYLSPEGKKYVDQATVSCDDEMNEVLADVQISTLFKGPINDPQVSETLARISALPVSGPVLEQLLTQIAALYNEPISDPAVVEALAQSQHVPTSGFSQPLFIAEGYLDSTAPYLITDLLVRDMRANGAEVDFHGYPTDHADTQQASLVDSTPFLEERFSAKP